MPLDLGSNALLKRSSDKTPANAMKRAHHLFESIVSFENLFVAARKGKRSREPVVGFEMELEREPFPPTEPQALAARRTHLGRSDPLPAMRPR